MSQPTLNNKVFDRVTFNRYVAPGKEITIIPLFMTGFKKEKSQSKMSSSQNNNMDTMTFQDLVILKQFLEKGFRENFFSEQEIPGAKYEHEKLSNIIKQVLKKNAKTDQ
jgi:hypothetical protein